MALVSQTWEIDSFYFPNAVVKGSGSYFPRALIIMDHDAEMALHHFPGPPEGYYEDFRKELLTLFERTRKIPERILVDKAENQIIFEPIASGLDIKLDSIDWLPGAEEFKENMFDFFLDDPEEDDF